MAVVVEDADVLDVSEASICCLVDDDVPPDVELDMDDEDEAVEIVSLDCLVSLLEIDDVERAPAVLVVASAIIEEADWTEAESLVLNEVAVIAENDETAESDVGGRVVKLTDFELRLIVEVPMELDESTVTIEDIVDTMSLVAEAILDTRFEE